MEVLDYVSTGITFVLYTSNTWVSIQEADLRNIQVAIAKGDLVKEDVNICQVIDGLNYKLTFEADGSIEEDVPALSVIPNCKIELMKIKSTK